MNIAVTGGRDYKNRGTVASVLRAETDYLDHIFVGDATGADLVTRKWAHINHVQISVFCAHWERWGNAAGRIRNGRILDVGKPELLIAFPGGEGTKNMKRQARERGIRVLEAGGV